jgi:hypothetical protein
MGDLLQFPGKRREREFPINSTPVEVLEEFLQEAKEDRLVFLSLAVYRTDGSFVHIELGLTDDDEDDPEDPPKEPA